MMVHLLFYKLVAFKNRLLSLLRVIYFNLRGSSIHRSTTLSQVYVNWPHQIEIGEQCIFEPLVSLKFDGPYQKGKAIIIGSHVFVGTGVEFNIKEKIEIDNDVLIGAGTRFIDHDHGLELSSLMRLQECPCAPIQIERDVWIGANAVILKGVTICKGAVVAAGAVVNQSIPAHEIWGGVPAKKIGERK